VFTVESEEGAAEFGTCVTCIGEMIPCTMYNDDVPCIDLKYFILYCLLLALLTAQHRALKPSPF